MNNATRPHRNLQEVWRWGCLGLLTFTIIGLLIVASHLIMQPGAAPPGPLPTGELLLATDTPTPTATPTSTPPPLPPTSIASEGIGIGDRVRVNGTGAAGLNLRATPGTAGARVTIAPEDGVFIVAGGPQEADSLTWWLLKDEANPEREGWGAANYLVETP